MIIEDQTAAETTALVKMRMIGHVPSALYRVNDIDGGVQHLMGQCQRCRFRACITCHALLPGEPMSDDWLRCLPVDLPAND